MSAVANASAKDQRSNRGLGQDAESEIIRESAGVGKAIHLAELIACDGIDFLSRQSGQGQQVVQISSAEEVKLIAKKFVCAISTEAVRAAEEKLRKPDAGETESGSAFADHEQGCRSGNGFEKPDAQIRNRKAVGTPRASVVPAEV